jgi:hypothetical protein
MLSQNILLILVNSYCEYYLLSVCILNIRHWWIISNNFHNFHRWFLWKIACKHKIRILCCCSFDRVRRCLWTAASNGPIFHSPNEI